MYFTERNRQQMCCICDGKKTVLVFARKSWQTNQNGYWLVYSRCSPLSHLFMVLQRGFCAVEWMTQCSQNKARLDVHLHLHWPHLPCVQLGWLDCETPSFVSTSTTRHNRIHCCGSYAHTVWKMCMLSQVWVYDLDFQFAIRWPRKNRNCETYRLKPRQRSWSQCCIRTSLWDSIRTWERPSK